MGINSVLPARVGITNPQLYRNYADTAGLEEFESALAVQTVAATLDAEETNENPASMPRMTVSQMKDWSKQGSDTWKGQIPQKAIFYDEVDLISRGMRDRGILINEHG
jgi:hypothetical protein